MPENGNPHPRLVFLVTVEWFFTSHFMNRAVAAKKAGYDVVVVTCLTPERAPLRTDQLSYRHWQVKRLGLNPLTELRSMLQLMRLYWELRPELVHQIALKPILYGSLAAWVTGVKRVINAPVGMGFVFSSQSRLARSLRPLVRFALRWLLNPPGSRVVFENQDDLNTALAQGLVQDGAVALIRGAGVDITRITPSPEPPGPPRVALVARMLWAKGVGEFVEAARLLQARGIEAQFILVGSGDPDNRDCIDTTQLKRWKEEGVVDWLGHRDDIAEILASCHIVTLPSYREGLPKSLLEAMAAGRPIVTTNVPGCRELVIPGKNGLLVPPRDAPALAEALLRLIADCTLRLRFGAMGRQLAEREFATQRVEQETLKLYADVRSKAPESNSA